MKRILYIIAAASVLMHPLQTMAQGGMKVMPGTTFKMLDKTYFLVLRNASFTSTTPVTTDSLIIKGSGNTANVNGPGPLTLQSVQVAMNSGGVMRLGRAVNVLQSVAFSSGLLDLNNNNITLDSAASLVGENDLTRAIGPNGGEIRITQSLEAPLAERPGNLGIIITSSADFGSTLIRRGHKVQNLTPGTGVSIARYYEIEPTNNTNLGAILRGFYLTPELNGQQENILTYSKSTDGGVNWVNVGVGSRNTTQNFVNLSGVQTMGRFALGSVRNPLPIKLLNWGASCGGTTVRLKWKVADPAAISRFVIQGSDDGKNWEATTSVPPNATGNYDTEVLSPSLYYRLLSEEANGNIGYSGSLRVNCGTLASENYYLQQNPVHDKITIVASANTDKTLRIRLIDIQGKTQKTQQELVPSGVYSFGMDVGALASGIYQIVITDERDLQVFRTKVLIQH